MHHSLIHLHPMVVKNRGQGIPADSSANEQAHLAKLLAKAFDSATIHGGLSERLTVLDECIEVAQKLKSYESLAELLVERIVVHRKQNEYERCRQDINGLKAILSELPEKLAAKYQIKSHTLLARLLYDEKLINEALQSFTEGLRLAEQFGEAREVGFIHFNISSLSIDQGDVSDAMDHLKTALRLVPKDDYEYYGILYQLAVIAFESGDHPTARFYIEEACAGDPGPNRRAILDALAGEIYLKEQRIDEALRSADRAVASARIQSLPRYLWWTLCARVNILFAARQYTLALRDNEELLSLGFEDSLCEVHSQLSRTYAAIAAESDTDKTNMSKHVALQKGREHLLSAEELLNSLKQNEKPNCLQILSEAKALLGDMHGAYTALKQANVEKDKLLSGKVRNEIGSQRLLMKVEREQHEREIEIMKRQQVEKELATASVHLAMQTELLGNFRNELRHIVRLTDEPITALKRIKDKLKELPCEQIDWIKFEKQFTDVHPEFKTKLLEQFPDLTKQEVKMCQLARLGLKSIEMAQLLCLSERSIESHRYTLRKKLGIPSEQNLTQFLTTIKA